MEDRILHALDLATVSEWDEAKRILEGIDEPIAFRIRVLIDELARHDAHGKRARSAVRHELGNMLTIAQANVEGMLDGVMQPSPKRLGNVRDVLASAAELLKEFRRASPAADADEPVLESFGFAELILARVDGLRAVAAAKNVNLGCADYALAGLRDVQLHEDREAIEHALVGSLLNAVRYTPPGGMVRVIGCEDVELRLELRKCAVAGVLDAIGPRARLIDRSEDTATVGVTLHSKKETAQ